MGYRFRFSAGLALATAAAVVMAAGALAAGPPPVDVAHGEDHVTASQGGYCWSEKQPDGTGSTLCADRVYPLPVRCSLKVKRGTKLTIDAGLPAQSVVARLMGPEPGSKTRKLVGIGDANVAGSQRWRFRVRKLPPEAAVLDIFVDYTQGDSNVWVGLDSRDCRKAKFPKP